MGGREGNRERERGTVVSVGTFLLILGCLLYSEVITQISAVPFLPLVAS